MLLVAEKADSITNLESLDLEQVLFYGTFWEEESKRVEREMKKLESKRKI